MVGRQRKDGCVPAVPAGFGVEIGDSRAARVWRNWERQAVDLPWCANASSEGGGVCVRFHPQAGSGRGEQFGVEDGETGGAEVSNIGVEATGAERMSAQGKER